MITLISESVPWQVGAFAVPFFQHDHGTGESPQTRRTGLERVHNRDFWRFTAQHVKHAGPESAAPARYGSVEANF